MIKSTFATLILICVSNILLSQQECTISGYIIDEVSRAKLESANIFDINSQQGTVSDSEGFFSLSLNCEKHTLRVSYIGYESKNIIIDANDDTPITIELSPSVSLSQIEITAESESNVAKETQVSKVEVPIEQIKKLPAFLGETDVIKALQLLPGVQSGGEGQSGLYVRGGSPDQNLILLDDTPIYNISHLFGFFSVFNADALDDVTLIKGGYASEYGGRLSSVIDIKTKDGSFNEFKGSGSIGLVASSLTLEGPINNGKTSFLVSGRRTYIDALTRPLTRNEFRNNGEDGSVGYFFYDLNAKITHRFNDNNKLSINFYNGNDVFEFNVKEIDTAIQDFSEFGLRWGNTISSLNYDFKWNSEIDSDISLSYSNYRLNTGVEFGTEVDGDIDELIGIEYISSIRDINFKNNNTWNINDQHQLNFGIGAVSHLFKPGTFDLESIDEGEEDFNAIIGQEDISAIEMDLYVEDEFTINDKLKLNAGLHASSFHVNGTNYYSLQPRVSARYLINDRQSLKASFATMRQYIHLLAFDGIGLPTDLWLPSTDRVSPQDSWQAVLGYAFKLPKGYNITLEAYYRNMTNLIAYREGSGLFEINDWQERITQGNGTSKGIEFFVQKKRGRFTGWIGYTLSFTDRQFNDLNNGETFAFRYDRRHDISIVAAYEIGERINISATWVYGTGNAVTISSGEYTTSTPRNLLNQSFSRTTVSEVESRNNFRMSSYHRGDISINFVKNKKRHTRTWSIGAYNVYNNKNPFFLFSDTERITDGQGNILEERLVLKQQNLFPVIPFVSYKFEF